MTSTDATDPQTRLQAALQQESSSARLQSALEAGTDPDPRFVEILISRSAVEPDFFVRDMLTWAITRHPSAQTVPRLLLEVRSGASQGRSQALHTLSKVGDPRGWSAITTAVLHDPDDEIARSAWRAAVTLVPVDRRVSLAGELCAQLGRGDRDVQRSLSRAIAALGHDALPLLHERASADDAGIRLHAMVTERLLHDPEEGFDAAVAEAQRVAALADAVALDAAAAFADGADHNGGGAQ